MHVASWSRRSSCRDVAPLPCNQKNPRAPPERNKRGNGGETKPNKENPFPLPPRRRGLRQGYVPPDGLQTAPPQGRAGPVVDSAIVQSSSAGGQDLCSHVAMGGQTPGVALVGGRVEDIREIRGRRPFFLDILHSLAMNIQDPDQFPRDLEQGVPLGSRTHPLVLPGIKELKGQDDGSDGAGWGTSSSLATCGS